MKRYIAIVLPLILAACSTTPPAATATVTTAPAAAAPVAAAPATAAAPAKAEQDVTLAQADAGIKCERTYVVGSHFPVKKCTTAEQREAEAKAARGAMESMGNTGTTPGFEGGRR